MSKQLVSLLVAGVCVAIISLGSAAPAFAQQNASEDSHAYKIGIVNLQRVMDEYKKQQAEVKKLDGEVSEQRARFEKLQNDFQAELKQFNEDKADMSEEERADKEAEFDQTALELQSQSRQAEAQVEAKMRRLKKELLQDIVETVEEIGLAENYHLILEADPETRTGVLFHSSTLNMTQKVIDRLNAKYNEKQ